MDLLKYWIKLAESAADLELNIKNVHTLKILLRFTSVIITVIH